MSHAKVAFCTLLTNHHQMCVNAELGILADANSPIAAKCRAKISNSKQQACLGMLLGDRLENKHKGRVISQICHLSLISLPKANIKHSHWL